VRYTQDDGGARAFYQKRGFVYWYGMDMLTYDGPRMREPVLPAGVEIRAYEDRDYDDFFRIMGESFLPQRRFHDFRPHDVREFHRTPEHRKEVLKNMDNMFVLLVDGKVAAISELEGNFIDTLGVDFRSRGRGFGKALMQHCINVLLDRGFPTADTSVLLGNLAAWRLYNILGFRRTHVREWACRWV
jgi:ribosomal protein S18 acetylase RimI-like enzyme